MTRILHHWATQHRVLYNSLQTSVMNVKYTYWFILDYHLSPWNRSFDLFRHRHIAIVSWGVHDLFFLEVCSWGCVSWVWCCPFFQSGWSSFVCIWVSRLVLQRSLDHFLWLRFLFYPVLCIPQHFLESASLQLLGESCLSSWLPMFRCHRVVMIYYLLFKRKYAWCSPSSRTEKDAVQWWKAL